MTFEDAVRIIGSLDLQWSEKPTQEELQADVDIEIDPISMLPENPDDELARLQQILNLMIQGIVNPQLAQKIAQEGMTINVTPIIEQLLVRMRMKDPDIFRRITPEESMGYASVQQLKFAQANVEAAMHGQPMMPPNPNDDHAAQLAVYMPIMKLLQEAGQEQTQAFQALAQLVQIQQAMLQQMQDSQATPGQKIDITKPTNIKI